MIFCSVWRFSRNSYLFSFFFFECCCFSVFFFARTFSRARSKHLFSGSSCVSRKSIRLGSLSASFCRWASMRRVCVVQSVVVEGRFGLVLWTVVRSRIGLGVAACAGGVCISPWEHNPRDITGMVQGTGVTWPKFPKRVGRHFPVGV